ncbi:MAG: SDR family NAD(P)-dependent oxidoreductase [Bacterioplanes sp.]|nr:SDR family NAD(P)-dependent oxidoreductase [Bacterioplanes sp.]
MKRILIVGAGGGIASALMQQVKARQLSLMTISRGNSVGDSEHLQADLSREDHIPMVREWLAARPLPDVVIVCSGMLHRSDKGPEKTLRDFDDTFFIENLQTNVLAHVHMAQAMMPLVKRDSVVRWLSLSAMVGSITDNRLGGWYSYRMSKAALNMFIRNMAIEWQRKAPKTVVVAVHPGTTDTALSRPFQANVATDKLYQPQQTAERILRIAHNVTEEDSGYLFHWDGTRLPF